MNIKEVSITELLEELNRRLSKEKVKAFLEKRKEMKAAFKEVLTKIATAKVKEPTFYFKFPDNLKDFDVKTLMKWYEAVELYYHFAKRWEEQERGMTCSVDRAYHRYLKPKCKELLEFLRKFKIHSDEKYEGLMELAGCGYDYLHTGATFEFEIDAEKKIITARQFPKIIRKR